MQCKTGHETYSLNYYIVKIMLLGQFLFFRDRMDFPVRKVTPAQLARRAHLARLASAARAVGQACADPKGTR